MTDRVRRHIVITGTGRAGTTFLVELLTELGLDTGRDRLRYYESAKAGLEYDIRKPDAPYVVKNPLLITELRELLARREVSVDHAILPIRDIESVVASRTAREASPPPMFFLRRWSKKLRGKYVVPGGLMGVSNPDVKAADLRYRLAEFLVTVAEFEIPITILSFPRLVDDGDYLFRRLGPVFPDISRKSFMTAFAKTSEPQKVTIRPS